MGLLSWLRRLYSLDTLDTRFTVSSTSPLTGPTRSEQLSTATAPTSSTSTRSEVTRDGKKPETARNNSSPRRWNTLEFYVYYIVVMAALPTMFKVGMEVSKHTHPMYSKYSERLSPGWIPGRKVDNSDTQYAGFRDNVPYIAILLIVHPCLRRVYNFFRPAAPSTSSPQSTDGRIKGNDKGQDNSVNAEARLKQRVSFDTWFALIFLGALHGFSTFKILGILWINYSLATRLPRAYIPLVTWTFNIGILFANEFSHGYRYADIVSFFSSGDHPTLNDWATWLDSWGGMIPRWEVLFKVTVLRLISFNLDYYWSLDYRSGSPIEKKQLDPAALSERDRVSIPAPRECFSLMNYFAYILYSPLYLAGPIVTFNHYIYQQKYPPPSITKTRTILYGIRFLFTFLCMELILHYIYAVAISKSSPNWSAYTPFQLSMLGYFNLHIIWLKLLIPWRFFRLWALMDGIDPPENMVRCMSNNYSALAFWRGWHRSFNRWVVRYLYVPLGGGGNRGSNNTNKNPLLSKLRGIINFLGVFTFVALWHDINLRLLIWGWLVTLFVLPEVIASMLFPAHKWQSRPNSYRVICGIGAVGNVLMMMAANLVGFAVGVDGLQGLVNGIVGSYSGLTYMAIACACLFVGVQIMFEIREGELRAGIRLKC